MKKVLLTGITGQDGSYLCELLLSKGYEIHGVIRRTSAINTQRIDHLFIDGRSKYDKSNLILHYGDIGGGGNLTELLDDIQPDEIYHLAAQSHVRVSFDMAEYTGDVTGLGTLRMLEAMRKTGSKARFYQASSSEMFGGAPPPQNENSPFLPRSPYAVAKVYAYWVTRNYRDAYNLQATNGILFNHESPRRGDTFVTRKITKAIAGIQAGIQKKIFMGNLDARRDWGYAPDYVAAMWKMLQYDQPDDFVIGTGESHSIREFLVEAFGYLNMDWKEYVEIEPRYYRPTEVDVLLADTTKARKVLEWEPRVRFHELVKIMVDADLEMLGLPSPGEGRKIIMQHHGRWHRWEDQVSTGGISINYVP